MRHLHYGWIVIGLFLLISLIGATTSQALAMVKEDAIAYFDLIMDEPAEAFLANAGVFMPSSSYDGIAIISRQVPTYRNPDEGMSFVDRWLTFYINAPYGVQANLLYGINYAYFNLNETTRLMWDQGTLQIYYYAPMYYEWTVCNTFFIADKNKPYGRVACIMPDFGMYGLVNQP
jgi:hypothetical protein